MKFGWIVSEEVDNILIKNKKKNNNKRIFKEFLNSNNLGMGEMHIIATAIKPFTGIIKAEAVRLYENDVNVYWGRFNDNKLMYWRKFTKEEFKKELKNESSDKKRYLLTPKIDNNEWEEVY